MTAPAKIDRAGILGRVNRLVAKMLGADAPADLQKKARGEAARYLGVASGADPAKKRRRKIRQRSQRRNR